MGIKKATDKKYLSEEEVVQLINTYQETKDQNILSEIVKTHIDFVKNLARAYDSNIQEDIFSCGLLGLIQAIERFNSNRKVKFLTYAKFWIDMRMRREFLNHQSVVRVSPKSWEQTGKYLKALREGKSLLDFNNCKSIRLQIKDVSLNEVSSTIEDNEHELIETIKDERPNPFKELEEIDMRRFLFTSLDKLSEKEQDLIIRRFGLEKMKRHTLDELANMWNLSRERVRQVILSAIRKLREMFLEELKRKEET